MVNTLAVDNEAKQTIEALQNELQKTKEKLQAVEELKKQSCKCKKYKITSAELIEFGISFAFLVSSPLTVTVGLDAFETSFSTLELVHERGSPDLISQDKLTSILRSE